LEVLRARAQKEDVEDFLSTIESVIPIIDRMVANVKYMEKHDINTLLIRLHNSLEAYEETVVNLAKTGRLMRFLTSNRLRKNLERLNTDLHVDIGYFVEIILKVQTKQEEKRKDTERHTNPSTSTNCKPIYN
jgi:hypothetical protein